MLDIEFSPEKNPDVISIVKQKDGNWKGYAQRHGTFIEVREIKPEDCLLALMTYE